MGHERSPVASKPVLSQSPKNKGKDKVLKMTSGDIYAFTDFDKPSIKVHVMTSPLRDKGQLTQRCSLQSDTVSCLCANSKSVLIAYCVDKSKVTELTIFNMSDEEKEGEDILKRFFARDGSLYHLAYGNGDQSKSSKKFNFIYLPLELHSTSENMFASDRLGIPKAKINSWNTALMDRRENIAEILVNIKTLSVNTKYQEGIDVTSLNSPRYVRG